MRTPLRFLLGIALLFSLPGCLFDDENQTPEMEILLHSGIRQYVALGDLESQVLSSMKQWKNERKSVTPEGNPRTDFSHMLAFPEVGSRVYFLNGRVALIEVQEPFHGRIQGKNLKLFTFSPPPDRPWDEVLIREFGSPLSRASGGRFNTEALYFSWGDVSFNRNGPNEIALYRDSEIMRVRQRAFGREVKFFSTE